MGRLRKYIRPYYAYILLAVTIKLSGAVLELWIPDLMEKMLDVYVPLGEKRGIWLCGGGMVLCAAGCLALNIIANRMSAISSGKITKALRHDLFAKLEGLSARQLDELTVSSAESRLTSDTYNVNQLLARVQRLGIRAPILLLGGVGMMLRMDVPLALVLIALLPLIVLIVWWVTKTSVPLYTRQQSVLDRVVRTVQENITGIRVIKALSKTDYERQRFRDVNGELTDVEEKAGRITSITNPAATLVLNLGLTLVVVAGAYRVNSGGCKSGVIVAFLQYFTMILNALLGVTRIFIMFSKGQASANRVADVLNLPPDLEVLPAEKCEETGNHIEFRDVSFSYTGKGDHLEHVSFALKHGGCLGILGPTGAGKSTLVNLLLRLYDRREGEILLDGRDVRTIPTEELRKKFGVVFQNDFVMRGTIGENISFFRGLPEEDLTHAAGAAQAGFIAEKEGGMAAEVTARGNNLSGGQKQRLLIARALAGKPDILVLDDASSALDYRTDANLRHALNRAYAGVTTIIVAQRVSSLRHADEILVLDDGKVLGQGTHEHLMNTCPEYALIARTQMGEGKEGA